MSFVKVLNRGCVPLVFHQHFSYHRSLNLNPQFEPQSTSHFTVTEIAEHLRRAYFLGFLQVHPQTLANNARNNTLPREYERMMQKIMFRIGPTTIMTKRLKPMLMSKRETKFSEEARLSTPQGREIMYRRLLRGKRNLVPFGK